jgi:zinc transport system ATP-binding protein
MRNNQILVLNNISGGYNNDIVLENVNLTLHKQDFVGVIGPNGGGKTTLIKVILGLITPAKGTVRFFNENGNVQKPVIGYLPQISQIDMKFPATVFDVILTGLEAGKKFFSRITKSERKKINGLIDWIGLNKFRDAVMHELSGGQKQRVFLARALACSPSFLILDEPDTFVDSDFENKLYEILSELNKDMTILMVSHDIGMISSYVKTIACVNRTLHHHPSNKISYEALRAYNCPIELVTHGTVPHRVLKKH